MSVGCFKKSPGQLSKGSWPVDIPERGVKQISLCLIVGNVSEYIQRCLSSFSAIADEIIVVRAVGSAAPDDTLDIAQREFGAIVGEYINKPGHRTWPHVDDFAAARQQAFDMATGQYCFWADSDDILASGAEVVRELAERGGYPVFIFPYDVFGRGVVVQRERMMLREAGGRWASPVHEYYQFPVQVDGYHDQRVVVQHLPKPNKTGSTERNLRILESIPDDELNAGLLYHLHCEQFGAGRKLEAIETAKRALAHPEIGTPEKYELFLNLARLSTSREVSRALIHQAYVADPTRREALGMLSCTAIDRGQPAEALAFARQMMATERPQTISWNDRGAAYTWLGVDILQQALRAAGRMQEAETCRRQLLTQSGQPVISLIHATRGRAYQASMARKAWLDLAEYPEAVEHIFAFDEDDRESFPLSRFHHVAVTAGGGCVRAWNVGAAISSGHVLIQVSDDWMPPAKWDTEILSRLGDLDAPKVLAVSDGHRSDQLLCMAILTRARYAQQTEPGIEGSFLFHPNFLGVYSDNWFSHCALRDGVIVDARDLVFEHQHPIFTGEKMDATYAAQNSPERYAQGKAVFDRLLAEDAEKGHGFSWRDIPGWCDYRDLYSEFAERLQDGETFVEIGAWFGQSTAYIAAQLKAKGWRGDFWAFDTWRGEENQPEHLAIVAQHGGDILPAFQENMRRAGVDDIVAGWRQISWEAAGIFREGQVTIAFIDAAHDYESVRKDIAAWWPKVRAGGILAGHDYPCADVAKAVREFFDPLGLTVRLTGRCWAVEKRPIVAAGDTLTIAGGAMGGEYKIEAVSPVTQKPGEWPEVSVTAEKVRPALQFGPPLIWGFDCRSPLRFDEASRTWKGGLE